MKTTSDVSAATKSSTLVITKCCLLIMDYRETLLVNLLHTIKSCKCLRLSLIGISNVSTTDLVNFVNNYGLQVKGVGVAAVQQISPVPVTAHLGSGASGSNKSAHSGSFRSGFVRVSSPNLQNTRGTKSSLESTPKHCPHSVLQTRVEPKFNTFLMQLLFGGQHLALLLSPPKIVLYTLSQILSSQVSLGKHSLSTQMKLSSQAGLHSPVVVVAASGVVVVASAVVVVASAVVVVVDDVEGGQMYSVVFCARRTYYDRGGFVRLVS